MAVIAGGIIAVYTRYTAGLPFYQLILGSHAFIISNVIVFWYLIVFFKFAWAIYAFYIWSAIVGILAIAQFWTLADLIFTSREAKRLFGIFSAGGSLGAILGGFASGWLVDLFARTDELFWFIATLFTGAFGVVWLARNELCELKSAAENELEKRELKANQQTSALGAIGTSRYLQLIASAIFVSVVVSTLIDFQFKAAAKAAYASQMSLTTFFGSYYAWLAVITFFGQVVLTRRFLTGFGLIASLLVLPVSLFRRIAWHFPLAGTFLNCGNRLNRCGFATRRKPERDGDTLSASLCECKKAGQDFSRCGIATTRRWCCRVDRACLRAIYTAG